MNGDAPIDPRVAADELLRKFEQMLLNSSDALKVDLVRNEIVRRMSERVWKPGFPYASKTVELEGDITLKPFLFELVAVRVVKLDQWHRQLSMTAKVIGEPEGDVLSTVSFATELPPVESRSYDLAQYVFDGLLEFLEHELKEKVFLRGKHLRDPHPEQTQLPEWMRGTR